MSRSKLSDSILRRQVAAILAIATVLTASVSTSLAQSPLSKGAVTPGDAALEFSLGLLKGQTDRAAAVSYGGRAIHTQLDSAAIQFGGSTFAFRRQFIATYGRAAWDMFNDPQHKPDIGSPVSANGRVTAFELSDLAGVKQAANDNQNGDSSFYVLPTDNSQVKLIKEDGRWFIDSAANFPADTPDETLNNIVNLLKKLYKGVETARGLVGARTLTPDHIDFELGRAIVAALGQADLEPAFDAKQLVTGNKPTIKTLNSGIAADETKWTAASTAIVNGMLKGDTSAFIRSLHPSVSKYISNEKLQAQFQRAAARFGGFSIDETSIELFDYASDKNSSSVFGKFIFREHAADFELFIFEDRLIGMRLNHGNFAMDTLTVHRGDELLTKASLEFTQQMFAGKPTEALQAFQAPLYCSFSADQLKNAFRLLLGANTRNEANFKIDTRVVWPPDQEAGLILEVVHVGDGLEDGQPPNFYPTLIQFDEQENGNFEVQNIEIDRTRPAWLSEAFEPHEDMLRLLGAGDADGCIEKIYLPVAKKIERPLFRAFCAQLNEEMGPLERIDRSDYKVVVAGPSEDFVAVGSGNVKFAKGTVHVTTRLLGPFVLGFTFGQGLNVNNWQAEIKNTSTLFDRAEPFARALISLDGERMKTLAPEISELLDQNKENMQKQLEPLLKKLGQLKSVERLSPQYVEEETEWRCRFGITYENGTAEVTVDLYANPFNGSITGFNFIPVDNQQASPESK